VTSPTAARPRAPVPLDCNAYIGAFPFRHVPHPDPDVLVRVLAREGIASAWVGHLPSAFHRDPTAGNAELVRALAYAPVLRPAPSSRPLTGMARGARRWSPRVRRHPGHPQLWGWRRATSAWRRSPGLAAHRARCS
jgi:hypothetical protein